MTSERVHRDLLIMQRPRLAHLGRGGMDGASVIARLLPVGQRNLMH